MQKIKTCYKYTKKYFYYKNIIQHNIHYFISYSNRLLRLRKAAPIVAANIEIILASAQVFSAKPCTGLAKNSRASKN